MHRTRADQPYVGIPTPGNDQQEIGIPGGKFLAQIDRYEWRPPRYWQKGSNLLYFTTSTNLPAKYGEQSADIQRAVFETPLFDTRPWLRNDYNAAGNRATQEIDTGFFDDAFDVFATFMVYPPNPAIRLVDAAGFSDVSVFAFRFGHPTDPDAARVLEQPQDLTLDWQQTANEAWSYELAVMGGYRFIGVGLVFDYPTGANVDPLELAASFQ